MPETQHGHEHNSQPGASEPDGGTESLLQKFKEQYPHGRLTPELEAYAELEIASQLLKREIQSCRSSPDLLAVKAYLSKLPFISVARNSLELARREYNHLPQDALPATELEDGTVVTFGSSKPAEKGEKTQYPYTFSTELTKPNDFSPGFVSAWEGYWKVWKKHSQGAQSLGQGRESVFTLIESIDDRLQVHETIESVVRGQQAKLEGAVTEIMSSPEVAEELPYKVMDAVIVYLVSQKHKTDRESDTTSIKESITNLMQQDFTNMKVLSNRLKLSEYILRVLDSPTTVQAKLHLVWNALRVVFVNPNQPSTLFSLARPSKDEETTQPKQAKKTKADDQLQKAMYSLRSSQPQRLSDGTWWVFDQDCLRETRKPQEAPIGVCLPQEVLEKFPDLKNYNQTWLSFFIREWMYQTELREIRPAPKFPPLLSE